MKSLNQAASDANMTPGRLLLALGTVLLLSGLQLWQTVTERDDWPLSSYPMYSWMQGPTVARDTLVGVTATGEIPLTSKYTTPLTGSRLRQIMARGKTFNAKFAAHVCDNLKRFKLKEEFSAIRFYRNVWKIDASLKGMNRLGRLHAAIPAFCPDRLAPLLAEEKGTAEPAAALAASAGDIVLELEDAQLSGNARLTEDRYAHGARAVRFEGKARTKKPSKKPKTKAVFQFNAEAGDYYLWVRGKSTKGRSNDSVWVQLNQQVGTDKTSWKAGIGNFRPTFPANAYAWSSSDPTLKPAKLHVDKSGKQTLQLSVREGPVIIDQLVLTERWIEHPLHNRPLQP